MPTCCIAAGCDTVSGKGYSLHKFPRDESMRKQWVRAVKHKRSNWDGPTSSSYLCSKHFKPKCFVTDGVWFCEKMGIPAQKHLKSNAVPTIFARSVDNIESCSCKATPTVNRKLPKKRKQQSVSMKYVRYRSKATWYMRVSYARVTWM